MCVSVWGGGGGRGGGPSQVPGHELGQSIDDSMLIHSLFL